VQKKLEISTTIPLQRGENQPKKEVKIVVWITNSTTNISGEGKLAKTEREKFQNSS
jgi:hypothetical protein